MIHLPKIPRITIRAFLPVFLLVTGQSRAQEQPAGKLAADLDQYRNQRLQEKVFVHTDKDFYLAGEICWFKLYTVDAVQHHPLDMSKVAYLEWLDKDNKPVLQAKIGLHKGMGDGSVYLPLTFHTGHYKLRAYTSWMKNFGADWFFEKDVTIVNARRSAETPVKDPDLQVTLDFFPEGGNLVAGIASKIAFRISDQYGHGLDYNGVITEDDNDTVLRFHPWHAGIGNFMLTPRPGHRYRATVRLADGTAINRLLPTAYKEGTVMSLTDSGGNYLRIHLQSTDLSSSSLFLIADTRQSVKSVTPVSLINGNADVLLEKNLLGDGVSHLTVFNSSRQPVCERLYFKYPGHRLHIDINADKPVYDTRKLIQLRVNTSGENKTAETADCSISIFRLDSLQNIPDTHIADYLLLASDLKGKIESPDYYFTHPGDVQAIDNLLLSHGWRRFRWEDVLSHATPSFEFPPEYNGAIISGKLTDIRTGNAPRDGAVQGYLSAPGIWTQFSSANSDDQGRIRFEIKNLYGGRELIAQTDPRVDSQYRIDIANPFAETYSDNALPHLTFSQDNAALLSQKSEYSQVLNRYGGEKLKKFNQASVDTGTFYGKPDYSYLLDDYTRFTTLEEVMREYVVLMLVKKDGPDFHLPLFNITLQQFFGDDPLILLDGVPVFSINQFMTLDPLKIRKLQTVHQKFFLGGTSFNGIMNWTTYKGDLGGYIIDPHATVVDYEGLQLQREFYAPTYATDEQIASHLPDFRNLLFWAPELSTGKDGSNGLSFYSSDLPGKYVIVAEGITENGVPGTGMAEFEVK